MIRIIVFLFGLALTILTLYSAIQTFVLPRSARNWMTSVVFITLRKLFDARMAFSKSYHSRDRIMAYYAPVSLLGLLVVWAISIFSGYMAMFWAVEQSGWYEAFRSSGSSLFTLGFASIDGFPLTMLAFTEAMIGLILVALLIAYLPTMYSAFSRRETAVTLLEVRAGSPPSAIEMIKRYHRIHGLEQLHEQWLAWESWFADIEESHTSLTALVFFRSPQPQHSWVTASGAVLDAASLVLSAVDVPHDPQADLCIRAGYLALRHIADFFDVHYEVAPDYNSPMSVQRVEFDQAWEDLEKQGVPMKADRELAWKDYRGWRVNYDGALISLASITMAPLAPWSSDRDAKQFLPPLLPHTHKDRQKTD